VTEQQWGIVKVNELRKVFGLPPQLPEGYRPVLDKGYVGLLGVHGDDHGKVSPPNAARASFKKSSDQFTEEQNNRLTHHLMKKSEFACFRHNAMTFEIRMPLMVARQYWKYVVGSNWTEDQLGWNENSKRYITEENEFYIPEAHEWRTAPHNKKQGSGETMVPLTTGQEFTDALKEWTDRGEQLYQLALERQFAPEQARLFTANGNYVTVQWTTSLNALLHFLDERLDDHAQWEIRQYAEQVREFFKEAFPAVHSAWDNERTLRAINQVKIESYDDLCEKLADAIEERDRIKTELKEYKSKKWYKRLFSG